ncbi:MAG TPA: carboxypeptidase regulatory-like domain-containing protein [Candidatus Binatia bacterium]|jgi:streptogramin lyase
MNRSQLFAAFALAAALAIIAAPACADVLLSGTLTSSSGEKMGGVTVSAKAVGSPITTSVFTDESGGYYFPALPGGKYRVWAQALTYQRAEASVDLQKKSKRDFVLKPIANKEDWIRQLPGDELLAALPGDTPEDYRMKTQVRKNCTGCHSASYPLQHRFDETGWNKILDLMKHVNVLGVYQGPEHKPTPNIQFHQKELVAYLAKARGPGESSMKFKLRPRPSGEAARAVIREYDFPMEQGHTMSMDGSDWSLGTGSSMNHVAGPHDAQMDFDGNIWITHAHTSLETTVARIDGKTGKVKHFRIEDQKGIATGTHGITRDEHGDLWFNTRSNVARARGGLAKIDPKTEKITVYIPPEPMSGTAGTLDADLNGNVWVTAPDGALRFNIKEEKFTEFKSITYKNKHGTATVYGLAADRAGNGWWLLMAQDLIDYSDIKTGKSAEFKLPPEKKVMENLTADQKKMYETFQPPDFNTPFAWAQAPRRMGADKNSDFVYVGNSFGGTLAKINIVTKESTLVPLPNPETDQPYQIAVDKNHGVWTNLWSTDKIAKYDAVTGQWTLFDLPTRGTESRHISILERDGQPLRVVVPYERARKVAVLTPRSEAEIRALKNPAARQ